MPFDPEAFFHAKRDAIIHRWVDLLKTEVGEQYSARPRDELMGTVTKAYDAEVDVVLNNDYKKINAFIHEITKMRLEAGFLLSDVQKAFEFFRRLAIELMVKETELGEFYDAVVRMNDCLNYTIHSFSDYFQAMHQKKILEHNRMLEKEIRARTAELRESELIQGNPLRQTNRQDRHLPRYHQPRSNGRKGGTASRPNTPGKPSIRWTCGRNGTGWFPDASR